MTIEVNYQGMRELGSGVAKNKRYLEAVHTFITGHNADFGAFNGFLSVFRSDYESAYQAAEQGVDKGYQSAGEMHDRINTNRERYRTKDLEASELLGGITIEVGPVPLPSPSAPDDGSTISQFDRNVENATGVSSTIREGVLADDLVPKRRKPGLGNVPVIDLAGYLESTGTVVGDINEAEEQADAYGDFEKQGGKR